MAARPKIGFLVLGHTDLDPRMNKNLFKEEALRELTALPLDLVDVGFIPKTKEEMLKSAQAFRAEDVDALLIYAADYFTEELACLFLEELFEKPHFLWTHYGSSKAIVPVSSLLILASHYHRLHKNFTHHIGEPQEAETKEAILRFAKAAATLKRLRRSSIGVVGHANPGMLDTTYSEFHLRKLVPHILYLDSLELLSLYNGVAGEAAAKVVQELQEKVKRIDVGASTLLDAARSYLAMKGMMEKYGLDGITIREWPELGQGNFSMCLGTSLLADEGKICIQESDPPSVVTGLILQALGCSASYLGEIGIVDRGQNAMLLRHEGAAPMSMAASRAEIRLTHADMSIELFYKRKEGVTVEFLLKPGRVTLTKLSGRPVQDRLRMFFAQGEAITQGGRVIPGRSTALIQVKRPIIEWLDDLIQHGMEHHFLVGYGDFHQELQAFCRLAPIEAIPL